MWKCIFLLVCAFQFGGGDVFFFFPDGIVIVLNSILQYLVSLEILICWTDWNRMSCGLCKGSENICLFLMEIQETYRNQKARRAYLPGGKHWKGRSPLEEEWTICDQLFQDTLEEIADFSCLFWCWIFLRLLDLWLHEFLHVELQRAHMHWSFPQSHLHIN